MTVRRFLFRCSVYRFLLTNHNKSTEHRHSEAAPHDDSRSRNEERGEKGTYRDSRWSLYKPRREAGRREVDRWSAECVQCDPFACANRDDRHRRPHSSLAFFIPPFRSKERSFYFEKLSMIFLEF